MGITIVPVPSSSKTRYVVTLTSGTSWTVPSGVTYINVTLRGGGGGGSGGMGGAGIFAPGVKGLGGSVVTSTITTTPNASITYAIGGGGAGAVASSTAPGNGGTTSMTGATSASGGNGAGTSFSGFAGTTGTPYLSAENGGAPGHATSNTPTNGGAGGAGSIDIEYWV